MSSLPRDFCVKCKREFTALVGPGVAFTCYACRQASLPKRVCRECGATFRHYNCNRCEDCQRHRYEFMFAERNRAHQAVAKARSKGLLPPPRTLNCADCGGPAVEYDHRDYTKPLEVEPVCRRCNLLRGPGKRAVPYAPRLAV